MAGDVTHTERFNLCFTSRTFVTFLLSSEISVSISTIARMQCILDIEVFSSNLIDITLLTTLFFQESNDPAEVLSGGGLLPVGGMEATSILLNVFEIKFKQIHNLPKCLTFGTITHLSNLSTVSDWGLPKLFL